MISKGNIKPENVLPGALVSLIQKGVQYMELETHIDSEGNYRECLNPFTLLQNHECSTPEVAQTVTEPYTVSKMKQSERILLEGHKEEAYVCSWSPNDEILASGSGDSTCRLWRTDSCIVLRHEPDNKDVTSLDWNANGSLLATGGYDGYTRIWNAQGELVVSRKMHVGPIFTMEWNKKGNLLLSGGFDKVACVWNPLTDEVVQRFEFHTSATLDAHWKNNAVFATCSTDKTIKICKIGSSKELMTFRGHTDEINSIQWDPSGSLLASGSDDHTAKIWDPKQENFLFDLKTHTKEIYTVRWSPTGPKTRNPNADLVLATASFDSTVKLWNPFNGQCIHTLSSHEMPVYSVSFSPNGSLIATGSFDTTVKVWQVQSGKLIKDYEATSGVFEVEFNHKGDKIAACTSGSTVCVFSLE